MKCKVNIRATIEINWEPEDVSEDNEGEIIRDLYEYVKNDPIRFMDKRCWNPEEIFVAVSKG